MDTATFQLRFDGGEILGANVSDSLDPLLFFAAPADQTSVLTDAASFEFEDLELVNQKTEDEKLEFGVNFKYETFFGANPGAIKFGAKATLREKSREEDATIYEDNTGLLTMAPFVTSVDYPLDALGLVPDPALVRSYFAANPGDFDIEADDTFIKSTVGDFDASEDVLAAYLMGRVDIDSFRVVGGARVEYTEFEANANEVDAGAITSTAVSVTDDYVDVLPSVNVRWEVNEDLIGRAAYFSSIARPNFKGIVPAAEIEEESPTGAPNGIDPSYSGELGNADLERQKAHNFDVTLAWYPTGNSVVQGGVFYKDMKDFIAFQTQEDVFINTLFFEEAESFINLDEASLLGFEFKVEQAADFLPAPFDGLIYGVNLALVDGEATLPSGIKIPLPKQSERIVNATVGYEKGRVSVRAALSHRSEYLEEIIGAGGTDDIYIDDHTQLDLKGSFDITDQIKIFGEINNITDEPETRYFDQAGNKNLAQYEEYGFTAQFGVSFKY